MAGYPETPTRFVHPVGWKGEAGFWWGECGTFHHSLHLELRRGEGEHPEDLEEVWGGYLDWRPELGSPCERCGEPFPGFDELDDETYRSWHASCHTLYDTESGELEPGCMWWNTRQLHENGVCTFNGWTNCDGRHLMVMLPNRISWDVDSRANNCDKPDDTTHRCWVREGNPETEPVTAGKQGNTCTAGAGSIAAGDYHGFLVDGVLSPG